MIKLCQGAHVEIVRVNNGADQYCLKEESRVEGPWTFGVKPARRNKKGEVAERNKRILEYGVAKAVEEGLVDICRYKNIKQSVDLYKLDQ